MDLSNAKFEHNGVKYKLQIWDTAGQERYKALSFSECLSVVVVVEGTTKDSWSRLFQGSTWDSAGV